MKTIDLGNLQSSEGITFTKTNGIGYRTAPVGDLNKDGKADMIIDQNIIFGKAFTSNQAFNTINKDQGFSFSLTMGTVIKSAGDVNNDTYIDLISGNDLARTSYLSFQNGTFKDLTPGNFRDNGGSFVSGSETDFGEYVSGVGDYNKDGFSDFVCISSQTQFLFLGSLDLPAVLGADPRNLNMTIASMMQFAKVLKVSPIGDFNKDGFDDFLLGSPFASPSGRIQAGQVHIVFGKDSLPQKVYNETNTDASESITLIGGFGQTTSTPRNGGELGESISPAGDFNGDGFADVVVGAPYAYPGNRFDVGQVVVIFGRSTSQKTIDLSTDIPPEIGFKIIAASTDKFLGSSVSGGKDFNKDGFDDVVIGADNASPQDRTLAGSVYVIFGKSSGIGTIHLDNFSSSDGIKVMGPTSNALIGNSVSMLDDVNGDGIGDLLIGSRSSDLPPSSYLLWGSSSYGSSPAPTPVGTLAPTPEPTPATATPAPTPSSSDASSTEVASWAAYALTGAAWLGAELFC